MDLLVRKIHIFPCANTYNVVRVIAPSNATNEPLCVDPRTWISGKGPPHTLSIFVLARPSSSCSQPLILEAPTTFSVRVTAVQLNRRFGVCQVIYSQFGWAIHQNDHQARRRFVEWAQNEIAVVLDFHKRILFSDEVHFWLNGYVNKQNCHIWSEANPQVYAETPLHPEKLTVWCALWDGGILLQK
ncbi:uncharacterized protein TNCV_3139831 [Trichonephila clavipes]|nr:uncharacterized protein TNCV_3139831 [Trichonephila clavipes]